jgi:hypothetical protein
VQLEHEVHGEAQVVQPEYPALYVGQLLHDEQVEQPPP